MKRARHVLGIAAIALLLALPATARADAAACTVRAIHALTQAGGIDKRLAPLKRQLRGKQFSAYKTMRLLSSKTLSIAHGAWEQTPLPTGKVLKLQYKDKLLQKKRVWLRMHLAIVPRNTKGLGLVPGAVNTVFSIVDGGTMMVAGAKHRGGTLIIGITCKVP